MEKKTIRNGTHTAYPPLPGVAMISDQPFPLHATDTQQMMKNGAALVEEGLNAELIIPVRWKDVFQNKKALAEKIYRYYNVSNTLKIRHLLTIPAGRLKLERATHFLAALLYASPKTHEIIYTRKELIAWFSILLRRKTVFETYRRFGDEYPMMSRWMAQWARRPACLGIILHSNVARESLLKVGFPAEKMAVFHNGFDDADMQPVLTKRQARSEAGLGEHHHYVVYAGNMQSAKGVESIIDVAALLPALHFVLVGGTAQDVKRLEAYAASHQVANLTFTGHRPISEVSRYLYAADSLIIPPVSAPLKKYGRTVLPFKTFLYMAAGRPIVAPRQPDLEEVLVHGQNALLVKPDEVAECAAALRQLYNDVALSVRLGENAAFSVRELTWKNRAKKIIAWLSGIYFGVPRPGAAAEPAARTLSSVNEH